MSRIDIPKLAATPPASAIGNGARSGAASEQPRAGGAPRTDIKSTGQGVSVEVSNRVEPGQPPVDGDRVAQIRAAIQDGSYPVFPAEIADAMIAARYMLGYGK